VPKLLSQAASLTSIVNDFPSDLSAVSIWSNLEAWQRSSRQAVDLGQMEAQAAAQFGFPDALRVHRLIERDLGG
jgi:hypothetical protein